MDSEKLSSEVDKRNNGEYQGVSPPLTSTSPDRLTAEQPRKRAEGQIVSEREAAGVGRGTELDGESHDRRRLCRPNDKDAFVRFEPTSLSALPTLTRRSSRSLSQLIVVAHADPQGLDLVAFGLPADASSCAGPRRR